MDKLLIIVVIILFITLAAIADIGVTTAAGAACMLIWAHCRPARRGGFVTSGPAAISGGDGWNYQPPMLGAPEWPRDARGAVGDAKEPEGAEGDLADDGNNLRPEVLRYNSDMLRDVMFQSAASTDDRAADLMLVGGAKAKKSLDIRSHWNNHNWKKYYDYEFGIHENREWWGDNDYEHAKRHEVI